MRRFEWVLLIVAIVAVAWPVLFGVRPRRGVVAFGALIAIVVQICLEGYRWQLLPLYLLAIGLAVGDVIFVDRHLKWTNRVSRAGFGLVGLLVVYLIPTLLPVPTIPLPTGGIPVGTISVEVIDPEREDAYGPAPAEARRLMVQVWYPAINTSGQSPVLWSEDWDVVAPALSRRIGFPSWFLGHTRFSRAHAVSTAGVAPGIYPVVIYSHGNGGVRTIAVNQMESLASNGYIAIAIDHGHIAAATRFPDGDVVYYDPAALPSEAEVGAEAHLAAADRLTEVMAEDISTVIDALELGADGPLAFVSGAADVSRIGLFGHSAGGGAAIRSCLLDDRCDAVLGFDPWVEPFPVRVNRINLTRPALFMRSDDWIDTRNDALLRGVAGRGESITYWVGVDGTGHNDFVITPLFSPLASRLGLKGPIPAGRIIPIIDNYLIGFFDVFLLGTGSAALDTVRFPEVTVEVIGG